MFVYQQRPNRLSLGLESLRDVVKGASFILDGSVRVRRVRAVLRRVNVPLDFVGKAAPLSKYAKSHQNYHMSSGQIHAQESELMR